MNGAINSFISLVFFFFWGGGGGGGGGVWISKVVFDSIKTMHLNDSQKSCFTNPPFPSKRLLYSMGPKLR
jgi:hypothetical protein